MLRGFTSRATTTLRRADVGANWRSLARPVLHTHQWTRSLSFVPEKVRNVAIIAHVDHGNNLNFLFFKLAQKN